MPCSLGDLLDALAVAADQDRIGHDPVTVLEQHAALVAYRQHAAHQVLVVAHAAGDAVHDDAEAARAHA